MILALLLLIASSWGYEPLQGIKFNSTDLLRKHIQEQNIDFYFKYKYHKKDDYRDLIVRGVVESTNLSLTEIREQYPEAKDCKPYDTVEIYEVEPRVLNDKDRFEIKNSISQELWGFYDPRADENYIDSIVLTWHGSNPSYAVLVHEIAHYWYSRYCLDYHTKVSSEDFAVIIQNRISWSEDE